MAKILYFATLVDKLGSASEEVTLPATVADVQALLAWLRARGANWERALAQGAVHVKPGMADVVVGQAAQTGQGLVHANLAGLHFNQ